MGKIRLHLLCIAGAALLSPLVVRAAVPITLTPASYNQDAVVEATAVNDATTHYSTNITATMDGGTAKNGGVWYQQGLNTAAPTTGLPAPGVLVSAADASTSYLVQPYTANNIRLLDSANTPGTLTLAAPAGYSNLSFLTSSGNGTGTLTLTVHFADAFPDLAGLVVTSPDWFNASPVAYNSNGRVTASSGAFDNVNANNPRLYQEDVTIPANAASHPISSVDISFSGSGTDTHSAIFAMSGTPTPEPSAIGVIAMAAASLLFRRRR
jgi:hypothetical protein